MMCRSKLKFMSTEYALGDTVVGGRRQKMEIA
jgi:hypothetical protein